MTSEKKNNPNFLASPEPLPYLLRSGEFGVVTGRSGDGGYVGFLLPSELKTAWTELGSDRDGDSKYDQMVVEEEQRMVTLLVTLVIVGLVLYLINTYIPMDPPIKTVFNVVIVLVLCVWLLNFAGLLGAGPVLRWRQ